MSLEFMKKAWAAYTNLAVISLQIFKTLKLDEIIKQVNIQIEIQGCCVT